MTAFDNSLLMFNSALTQLIEQFQTLPGIGERTAQRLAFFMVKQGAQAQKKMGTVLESLEENLHYCPQCQNFSNKGLCEICNNDKRDQTVLAVIETPFDVLALESTASFSGLYHVLHGVLSPIDGVRPQDLKIEELINFLQKDECQVKEIIFSLNATLEAEATMNYIKDRIPTNITTTQLARGLPTGASLEYADEITLKRALQERR